MNTLHAIPAYGRVYKTEADLLADWFDGKDFKQVGGSYFSIRDYALLAEVYFFDNVAIKLSNEPISSVCYIPLI